MSALFLACLRLVGPTLGADDLSRTYDYRGFDAKTNLLVEGTITLLLNPSNRVSGNWTLQVFDKEKLKKIGKQDGVGQISGFVQKERIFLNLNPGVFGDNVYLDGRVSKLNLFKIKGTWGHYGWFVGKMDEGKFEMTRQKPAPKKLN